MRRLRILAALVVLAGGALLAVGPAGPAAAVALPGGKANYVVAKGSLSTSYGGNWVRLGTYAFTTDGRVRNSGWYWTQQNPSPRVGTGTIPEGNCSGTASTVRPCGIKTVSGFLSAAPESWHGSYTLHTSGGRQFVNIDWDAAGLRTEEWWVDINPDGSYARLERKYAAVFNHGYGYGSNAGFGVRRPMETVRNHQADLTMTYHRATQGRIDPVSGTWNMSNYVHCTVTTWCLTWRLAETSSSACRCAGSDDHSLQSYVQKLSNSDRRDTFWHWCTCLSGGSTCYGGNSHVYPLLQVIDDSGNWRGWVGVEASFYPYADSDPRRHDMLSVFRVAEWV